MLPPEDMALMNENLSASNRMPLYEILVRRRSQKSPETTQVLGIVFGCPYYLKLKSWWRHHTLWWQDIAKSVSNLSLETSLLLTSIWSAERDIEPSRGEKTSMIFNSEMMDPAGLPRLLTGALERWATTSESDLRPAHRREVMPMDEKVIGPSTEPTVIIILNSHVIILPYDVCAL